MAVLQMQRVSICALKKDRKAILEKIQSLGIMEMHQLEDEDQTLQQMDTQSQRQIFDRQVQQCEQALAVLDEFAPVKESGLDGLKPVAESEFKETIKKQNSIMAVAGEINKRARTIADQRSNIQKIENQIESLVPWMNLGVPLATTGTGKTDVFIGTMPPETTVSDIEKVISEKCENDPPCQIEIASSDKDAVYLSVACLKADGEEVEEALRSAGFARPSVVTEEEPKALVEKLKEQIKGLDSENEKLAEQIKGYAPSRDDIRKVSDYFRMRSSKYEVLGTLPQSDSTFCISGYVPKKMIPVMEKAINEKFDCVMDVEDLAEGEEAPVLLSNNAFSKNMEGVVSSYGLPAKTDIDPTAIMSIFYVIFFGMMLSDAVYGAIIAIACFIVVAKHPGMNDGTKRSLRMFGFCGISTVFWGVMYGGYAGDAIQVISRNFFGKEVAIPALWFEPLSNPMKLLIFCLLFGVIHLFTGLAIKGYQLGREKDFVGVISDVVSWALFVLGLILLLLPSSLFESISGMKFSFPPAIHTLALVMTFAGMLIILLMSGRDSKNWALRVGLGAYDIYGVTSWLSDILSYSRLLALGLATGVIANVVNMLAEMVRGGPEATGGRAIIGSIVFIIVMILGHVLNLGINLLGAYVHTNRLQFAEFFSKFYDAGGNAFHPFATDNKYIKVKEEH